MRKKKIEKRKIMSEWDKLWQVWSHVWATNWCQYEWQYLDVFQRNGKLKGWCNTENYYCYLLFSGKMGITSFRHPRLKSLLFFSELELNFGWLNLWVKLLLSNILFFSVFDILGAKRGRYKCWCGGGPWSSMRWP